MNNIVGTGTVSAAVVNEDNNSMTVNIVTHRSFTNKAGEVVHNRVLLRAIYAPRNVENAVRFEKGDRVGFKGTFDGDFSANGSTNGPHIVQDKEGNNVCAFEVNLRELIKIGAKAKSQTEYEDVLEIKLWGYLGRDAEMRYTADQQAVVNTSLAQGQYFYEGDKRIEQTIWWRLSYWGKGAEKIMKTDTRDQLWRKGTALIIEGNLVANQKYGGPNIWETQDGEARCSYEISVTSWAFAPGRKGTTGPVTSPAEAHLPAEDEEIPF